MLPSLQENKYVVLFLLFLLLLLLLQPTHMKFKQQQQQQQNISGMKVAPKRDKLHLSDLKYIYICIYIS